MLLNYDIRKSNGRGKFQTFRPCKACGKIMGPLDRLSQIACSRECGYKIRKVGGNKGKHYPSMQRARIGYCIVCGGEFRAIKDFVAHNPNGVNLGRHQKYCSKECWSRRHPPREKVCVNCFTKFYTYEKTKRYCSQRCLEADPHSFAKRKLNPDVDWELGVPRYASIHNWVERKLGKPLTCDKCGSKFQSTRKLHWANRDHTYQKDIGDWMRLCISCHRQHDKGVVVK